MSELASLEPAMGMQLDCRISQVVEGPIPFFSLCEQHGFPFFGRAFVGYVAHQFLALCGVRPAEAPAG
jgi:GTP cyclohydrolase I